MHGFDLRVLASVWLIHQWQLLPPSFFHPLLAANPPGGEEWTYIYSSVPTERTGRWTTRMYGIINSKKKEKEKKEKTGKWGTCHKEQAWQKADCQIKTSGEEGQRKPSTADAAYTPPRNLSNLPPGSTLTTQIPLITLFFIVLLQYAYAGQLQGFLT